MNTIPAVYRHIVGRRCVCSACFLPLAAPCASGDIFRPETFTVLYMYTGINVNILCVCVDSPKLETCASCELVGVSNHPGQNCQGQLLDMTGGSFYLVQRAVGPSLRSLISVCIWYHYTTDKQPTSRKNVKLYPR